MSKSKPHLKQSALKKTFADFRENSFESKNPSEDYYELKQDKEGYDVILSSERSASQKLSFKTRKEAMEYIKKHSKPQ